MSQTAMEVSRESRDPDPSTSPPSTRYAPQAAGPRQPVTPAPTTVAGNQVSMQTALTASNGDPLVALETILGERNTLSSQNSQLWKIIEKQRGMYNSLHKELDRVKADRDRLQGKSSGETSTKRPLGGESTPRNQITRSQSEDRREYQYSVSVLATCKATQRSRHVGLREFRLRVVGRYGRKRAFWCSTQMITSFFSFLFCKFVPNMARISKFSLVPYRCRLASQPCPYRLFNSVTKFS